MELVSTAPQLCESMPERPSVAFALAVALWPSMSGGAGEMEGLSDGAVLSIEIPPSEADAVLPALSWHVPWAVCPAASADFVSLTGEAMTPDRVSLQVHFTVTSVLFQPFALTAGRRESSVIVGSAVSIFTVAVFTFSTFPALSFE